MILTKNLDSKLERNTKYAAKRAKESENPKTDERLRAAKKRIRRAQRLKAKVEMVKTGKFKKKKTDDD